MKGHEENRNRIAESYTCTRFVE